MSKKINGRPFLEVIDDINRVSEKDDDIRMIEATLLSSRFLPENHQLLPLEMLSRFSRAPGANSPVIGRMVAEAAQMVLVTTERCIVPFYPCVSPSSVGVRRRTGYGPTHVLALTTVTPRQSEQQLEMETETETEIETETGRDWDVLAVVWGEGSGLQVWRCSAVDDAFQYHYRICNQVYTLHEIHALLGGHT